MRDAQDFKRTLELLSKERGLSKNEILESLIAALKSAIRKEYGLEKGEDYLEIRYNESRGEFEVIRYREVVEEVVDPSREVALSEVRKTDPDVEIGDEIGERIQLEGLGRIAAHLAKQVIRQRIRDIERLHIYDEYKSRVGEIVQGTIRRIDRRDAIVDLGRTEAIIQYKDQIPSESYKPGDRVKAYLKEVIDPESPEGRKRINMPQLVLSRACEEFIVKLFEREVPEISEGVVKIVSVAREPGQRTKIAVASSDPNIDPVGACVGMRGSRVQNIVSELKGERIDIVPYSENAVRFVCNALAPAEVLKVIMDEDSRSMDVIVADDKLAQAIGTRGQNVRLASELTDWELHIYSESEYRERQKEASLAFTAIESLSDTARDLLVKMGYTLESLASASPEEILDLAGIDADVELAKRIIEEAAELLKSGDYPKPEEVEAAEATGDQESVGSEAEAAAEKEPATDADDRQGEAPATAEESGESGGPEAGLDAAGAANGADAEEGAADLERDAEQGE